MKKIFLGLSVFFVSLGFFGLGVVQAKEQFVLALSKDKVAVGESFELKVGLQQEGGGRISISGFDIPGLENFQVTGTSTATSAQVLNGSSRATTETTYTLVPVQEGMFTLGPVQGSGGESDVVTVEVSGTKGLPMVGGIANNTLGNATSSGVDSFSSGVGLIVALVGLAILGVILIGRRLVHGAPHTSNENDRSEAVVKTSSDMVADTEATNLAQMTLTEIRAGTIAYLERQTATTLSHMTTKEVLDEVKKKITSAQYARVAQILTACDEGIYAKKQVANESLVTYYQELFKGERNERQ